MIRRCRTPIALMVLISAVLAAMNVAAAAPTVPPTPVIPQIQLPPGSKKVHFKVIVEGKLTATKNEDLGSADGITCTVSIHSTVEETTTFQRGKGLVLEFVRIGKGKRAPIIVQRAGRTKDTSHILRVKTRRTSIGTATRADPPGAPVSFCQPLVEDLTQGPDCGKILEDTERASFQYIRPTTGVGLLHLSLSPLGALPEFDCPDSQISPGLDSLLFGWPTPVMKDKMRVPISPAQIFGTKRVIVETLDTGIINAPPESVSIGSLKGMRTNFGSNKVTFRLIRVPVP